MSPAAFKRELRVSLWSVVLVSSWLGGAAVLTEMYKTNT